VYVLSNAAVFRVAADGSTAAACPVGTEPPPPQITYNSYIPHRSIAGQRLKVGARCSIACTASATATVKISRNRFRRKPVTFTLKRVGASLAANQRGDLILRIGPNRVKSMKKALRNRSRVTARVKVTLTGEDGSGGSGASTVTLVRPMRR